MQFHFLHSDILAMESSRPNLETSSLLSQIVLLYQNEGWWNDTVDTHALLKKLIANSHCFLVAVTDAQEVIAMGRAISDRTSDAYIKDVTVRKDYRNTGIGTEIITRIIERLQSDGITWIGLIAEKGSCSFYQKIGFIQFADAIPMIYRSRLKTN